MMNLKLSKKRVKHMIFAALATVSISTMVMPNPIHASSTDEEAIIMNLEGQDPEVRCIVGAQAFRTVRATNMYFNATGNAVNVRIPQDTIVTPGGGVQSNGRLFVVATGNRGGWVNVSDLQSITCR